MLTIWCVSIFWALYVRKSGNSGDFDWRGRDGSDIKVGRILSPHNGCLMEAVELWKKGRSSLLLLRDAVLGAVCTTSAYMSL